MNKQKYGGCVRAMLGIFIAAAMLCGMLDGAVPERVSVRGDALSEAAAEYGFDLDRETAAACLSEGAGCHTIKCTAKLFGILPIKTVDVSVFGDVTLIPGGVPFGVKLYTEGVVVMGISEVACGDGAASPAKDAGIREKDVICAIDGVPVNSAEEITSHMEECGGRPVRVTVMRDGGKLELTVTPVLSAEDGKYRTGMWIRDNTAGIGTVTYVDPEDMEFAGLGHGICEHDSGELVELVRGSIVNVTISSVIKGKAGCPGELKGYFSSGRIGALLKNNACGVYGVLAELPAGMGNEAMPIALADEICEGEAQLLCTTDEHGIAAYTVKLSNIDRSGRDVKNFVVTVTDPALLERTGGIVQGMSGSPLVQNGKLIGAVTHVCVNL
ncbi:MAG: SpoIVB peptidase [Ruminococcaceae bacterium]|nr:SpoIVB peptidase [Oscillospiraceae bacterium]